MIGERETMKRAFDVEREPWGGLGELYTQCVKLGAYHSIHKMYICVTAR
jgi:hypothetical protein